MADEQAVQIVDQTGKVASANRAATFSAALQSSEADSRSHHEILSNLLKEAKRSKDQIANELSAKKPKATNNLIQENIDSLYSELEKNLPERNISSVLAARENLKRLSELRGALVISDSDRKILNEGIELSTKIWSKYVAISIINAQQKLDDGIVATLPTRFHDSAYEIRKAYRARLTQAVVLSDPKNSDSALENAHNLINDPKSLKYIKQFEGEISHLLLNSKGGTIGSAVRENLGTGGDLYITPSKRIDGSVSYTDQLLTHSKKNVSTQKLVLDLEEQTKLLPATLIRLAAANAPSDEISLSMLGLSSSVLSDLVSPANWVATRDGDPKNGEIYKNYRKIWDTELKKCKDYLAKNPNDDDAKKLVASVLVSLQSQSLEYVLSQREAGNIQLNSVGERAIRQWSDIKNNTDYWTRLGNKALDQAAIHAPLLALSFGAANILEAVMSTTAGRYVTERLGAEFMAGSLARFLGWGSSNLIMGYGSHAALSTIKYGFGDKKAFDNFLSEGAWSTLMFMGLKSTANAVTGKFIRGTVNPNEIASALKSLEGATAEQAARALFGAKLSESLVLSAAHNSSLYTAEVMSVAVFELVKGVYSGNIKLEKGTSLDQFENVVLQALTTVTALKLGGRITKPVVKSFKPIEQNIAQRVDRLVEQQLNSKPLQLGLLEPPPIVTSVPPSLPEPVLAAPPVSAPAPARTSDYDPRTDGPPTGIFGLRPVLRSTQQTRVPDETAPSQQASSPHKTIPLEDMGLPSSRGRLSSPEALDGVMSTTEIMNLVASGQAKPVIIITGNSGSGKSTFVKFAEAAFDTYTRLVSKVPRPGDSAAEKHWPSLLADSGLAEPVLHENIGWGMGVYGNQYGASAPQLIQEYKAAQYDPSKQGLTFIGGKQRDIPGQVGFVQSVLPGVPVVVVKLDVDIDTLSSRIRERPGQKPEDIENRINQLTFKIAEDNLCLPGQSACHSFLLVPNYTESEIAARGKGETYTPLQDVIARGLPVAVDNFNRQHQTMAMAVTTPLPSLANNQFIPPTVTQATQNKLIPIAARVAPNTPIMIKGGLAVAAYLGDKGRPVSPDIDFTSLSTKEHAGDLNKVWSELARTDGFIPNKDQVGLGAGNFQIRLVDNPYRGSVVGKGNLSESGKIVEIDAMYLTTISNGALRFRITIDRATAAHARELKFENGSVKVLPPEALFVEKLLAGRGQDKGKYDIFDSAGLIAESVRSKTLNLDLVRRMIVDQRYSGENQENGFDAKIQPIKQQPNLTVKDVMNQLGVPVSNWLKAECMNGEFLNRRVDLNKVSQTSKDSHIDSPLGLNSLKQLIMMNNLSLAIETMTATGDQQFSINGQNTSLFSRFGKSEIQTGVAQLKTLFTHVTRTSLPFGDVFEATHSWPDKSAMFFISK